MARVANTLVPNTTTAPDPYPRYMEHVDHSEDKFAYEQRPEENAIDTKYIEEHVVHEDGDGDASGRDVGQAGRGGASGGKEQDQITDQDVDLDHDQELPRQPVSIIDLPPELIFHILSFLPNSRLNYNPLIQSPHATAISLPHDDYNTNANVDPEYHLRTELLDPTPYYPDAQLVQKSLYAVMRTCKRFYEIAKALMWVDVVVKGGRGWISVVEGLGEYVGEVWYDVAASRARSLVRRSSQKYVNDAHMRRLEGMSAGTMSTVSSGGITIGTMREESVGSGSGVGSTSGAGESGFSEYLVTPETSQAEHNPGLAILDTFADTDNNTASNATAVGINIHSPPIVEVAEHMQMLSTSAPVIPQLDQIMMGHHHHQDDQDLTSDSAPPPHQFPTSVPTSPQPLGPPILAPVVGDISIGPQLISGFNFANIPPETNVPGSMSPPSSSSRSRQTSPHQGPSGWRERDNDRRAPISNWRAAPSLIRKTSITRAASLSLSRGMSLARSKMRDRFNSINGNGNKDKAPDAEAEILIENQDFRVMRPAIDSPDLDYGEAQNKFESLDMVLRNGGTLSRTNSISGPNGTNNGRSSIRSQSHQTGVVRPKTRLEREKELRRDWEKERDLSRARARARSPSVLGGRRARSPSISRSKNRRNAADVGADGAESLMQILNREAKRQESAEGLPGVVSRDAVEQEQGPVSATGQAVITTDETREQTGGSPMQLVDGLPTLGAPIELDPQAPWAGESTTHEPMSVEDAHLESQNEESNVPEMTPADPEYEFEFELPTRLPPIPQIQSLSFANFRTTGTRRTQEEAVRGKFVTPQRLYHVLRNAPRLKRLAMTEYVDSALAVEVIEEIFLRGYDFVREGESESERQRLNGFEPMEALDLTGCVSSVFGKAMEEFVERWLVDPKERRRRRRQREMDQTMVDDPDARGERGRSRAVHGFGGLSAEDHLRLAEEEDEFYEEEDKAWVKPVFKHLKRLSLRGCVILSWDVIATLVGCCPGLTHLDLSFTRVSPATLEALGQMPDTRLVALSLARSTRLTSESVRNFLCDAPAASTIVDLNMFGDMTYLSPLNATDLEWILKLAPCFRNQNLRYLDLSSAPLTGAMLSDDEVTVQPGLRSLGLSYIPHLPLDDVTNFILKKASNVEILTLTHSSTQADLPLSLAALHTMMTLHGKLINPLTSPPFKIMSGPSRRGPHQDSPTRVRVIELSETVRRALGRSGGSLDWRVIKSKGGRGWFVDVSAGWVREYDPALLRRVYRFQRGLDKDHVWRRYLQALADADGKVGSSVGWHSHKCNVMVGLGMIAREEGLYGFSAFASDR